MSLRDKVASLKIAPKEFTVPAQDHHGHSARINFRMPPGMVSELGALMGHSSDFGWTTDSDFYRWAVRHALDTAGKFIQDGRLSNLRGVNHAARAIFAEQAEWLAMDGLIDEARKMVMAVTQKGGAHTLPVILKGLRSQLAGCNDEFWRERWLAQFDREFSQFFRTASLVDVDENEG